MMKSIKEKLVNLHHNENGDIPVGPILIIGVIAIPLVIALVAFNEAILDWLSDQMDKVTGDHTPSNPF